MQNRYLRYICLGLCALGCTFSIINLFSHSVVLSILTWVCLGIVIPIEITSVVQKKRRK